MEIGAWFDSQDFNELAFRFLDVSSEKTYQRVMDDFFSEFKGVLNCPMSKEENKKLVDFVKLHPLFDDWTMKLAKSDQEADWDVYANR